jgi:hypothetical protein
MKEDLIFKNWRPRASAIGNLMTGFNGITEAQTAELNKLKQRVRDSADNPKLALTDNMKAKLAELKAKRDAPIELSTGAKSYLDVVFRDVFWKRKRFLQNKYLEKGLFFEQNALALLSKVDNAFYIKNDLFFENSWVQGTPDNVTDIVRDTKCSYDLETFENSELSTLYKWQIKAYCWLTGLTHGQLVFALVNSPLHHLLNEKNRMFYQCGNPSDLDEEWIRTVSQLERNFIFDIDEFKIEYPHYEFVSPVLDFTIPEQFRIKKFDVELEESDIEDMKLATMLSREYLCLKEIEVYNRKNQ